MPPHSRGASSPSRPATILVRGLVRGGYDAENDQWHAFTAHEIHIGLSSSLAVSLLTLVALAIVLYFFFRMKRRSFRQKLIMLLMLSDGLQAISFFIFPIVAFTMGPIQSKTVFCQINGFILSLGIEASDIAVLYVAIHTALYVFKPSQATGQLGLYPYRRGAYVIICVVPILLASLAFINKPAYASDGLLCNLPVTATWPWLALSWIPRYVIIAILIILYSSIYFYVTFLMRKFDQVGGRGQHWSLFRGCCHDHGGERARGEERRRPSDSSPSTPPLAYLHPARSAPELPPCSATNGERQCGTSASSGTCPADQKRAANLSDGRRRTWKPSFFQERWRWRWPILLSTKKKADVSRRSRNVPAAPSPGHSTATTAVAAANRPNAAPPPLGDDEAGPVILQPASHAACPVSHPSSAHSIAESTTSLSPTPLPESARDPRRGRSDDELGDGPLARATSTRSDYFNRPYLISSRHQCDEEHGQRESTDPTRRPHSDSLGNIHPAHSHHCTCPLAPWLAGESASSIGTADRARAGEGRGTQTEETEAPDSMADQRDQMRRQLLYLFMYPLVYVLVWVAPLISYVMQWRNPDGYAPYALVLLSLISLSGQGFASAALFASREKPWRYGRKRTKDHPDEELSGPWCGEWMGSWSRRTCFDWRAWHHHGHSGVGPTKDEMHVHGRLARMRRDRECAEFEEQRRARGSAGWSSNGGEGQQGGMEWWERLENVYGSEYGLDVASRGDGEEKGTGV
ncbi:hypothetical protein ACRALDRAFT_2024293 [Sodiomyces alcalophilus JCM 7366]|uniref:uncharacterized protein n=1 Tax=Sodiomyces alcalophilus JCM 7366 TaxID=591952 RepID=UPI0039B3DAC1